MKKILSLLLVLILGVTLFAGCSDKKDAEIRTEVEIEEVITDPKQNAANIEKEKKEALEDAIEGKETETITDNERGIFSHIKGDIKEQKIYDDNAVVIIAKGFDFTGMEPEFLFEVENNAEHDFVFTAENVAINGFTMETHLNKTVYANKKEKIAIGFKDLTMINQRIKTIDELAFTINMTDSELKLTTGEVVLKSGLKAEEYPEVTNGTTVIDKDGVKITYLDMEYPNKYHYDPVLYFCVENTLSHEIGIGSYDREVTVNGKEIDTHFSYAILPNRKRIVELEIDNKDLAVFKVSTIETVTVEDWYLSNEETHKMIFKDATFTLDNLTETVVELYRGETE